MPRPKALEKLIEPETERQALAMVARGDSDVSIAKTLQIAPKSVYNIKQRNAELLANMKDRVQDFRAKQATKILDLSQKRIIEQLENEEANHRLTDLNTVSKTAYDQLRLEEGKPTSISSTTPVTKEQATVENLEALVKAINSSDEVEIQRIIFKQ